MKSGNFETNTGHRFVSKARTAYKIHIHTPDDTVLHRSVGYIKIGEKRGLRKAIKLRNELGYAMWGKFWKVIIKDPALITRLPHSLEPKIVFKPNPNLSDPNHRDECYLAKWMEWDGNKRTLKTVVRSVRKHGRLAAYTQTKRALLEGNKKHIDILQFMGRVGSQVNFQ